MKEIDIIRNLAFFNLDGLEHEITKAEILSLYKELVKVYHPDISAGVFKDGSMMAKLNGAKSFLIDNIDTVNKYIRLNNPRLRHIEEERMRAEAEAKARAEAEAAEAARKRAEEERRRREEEERARAEAERKAAEEKRKKEEAARKRRETIARKKAEAEAKARAEEETRRRAEAAERAREAEKARQAEEARKRAEAERKRKEEEARFNAMTPKQQKQYLKEKARKVKEEYRIKNAEALKAKRDALVKRLTAVGISAVVCFAVIFGGAFIYQKAVKEPRERIAEAREILYQGRYAEALSLFKEIGNGEADDLAKYCEAMLLYKDGKPAEAAVMLGALDVEGAFEKSKEIYWDTERTHNVLASGYDFCVGIFSGGSVRYRYAEGEDKKSDKTDIISVAAGTRHAVGLKNDGTVEVIIAGNERKATKGVEKWKNIVEVFAYNDMTVGLKSDGTVTVANSGDSTAIAEMEKWKEVVSLDITSYYYNENNGIGDTVYVYTAVGATADGRVLVASDGDVAALKAETEKWTDVKEVSVHTGNWEPTRIVALKNDGTVYAVGGDKKDISAMAGWSGIVSVHTFSGYAVGLTDKGTLVAVGADAFTTADISGIENAVYLAKFDRFLAVSAEGRVMTEKGKTCLISDWTGIKVR